MIDPGKAVFLSYASQDAEAAQQLCNALRAADIEVWFDRSELRGGDAWDALIRKQIKGCYLFVPIISANTQSREEGYFRREWNLAVGRTLDMAEDRTFLLPIVIDGTSDSEARVPDKFREVQWTRLPGGANPQAFLTQVRRLIAPEANAPKTPSPPSPPTRNPTPATMASPSLVSTRPVVRSVLPWVVSTALMLGVGYVVADKFFASKRAAPTAETAITVPAKAEPVSNKSIAVLPFVDMSEKKDQEYFSDGLSEELIDHLARSVDLKVIARTSSFQFKGKNEDVRTIAAKLGVANLLEGSVRTAGQAVRITAQLIRASDGTHLWSHSYDRQMRDIFSHPAADALTSPVHPFLLSPSIERIRALVADYAVAIAPLANQVIGAIAAPLTNAPGPSGEEPAGDLIADSEFAATSPAQMGGAVIAFVNAGGVRPPGFDVAEATIRTTSLIRKRLRCARSATLL